MKIKKVDIVIVLILVAVSFIGFMLKLPAMFRHHDRELHFLFYLLISIFLNLIYAQKKIINHFIIFLVLLIFGVGIEISQELSNHIFHKRIHGNFDPVDLIYNMAGLIFASFFWLLYLIVNKFTVNTRD